jgi:cyclin D1/2/4
MIKDLSLIKVGATKYTTFVPQSPIGVLDTGCMSFKSDELTNGSCPNSLHNSPNTKRRKIDGPSNGSSQ